LPFAQVPQEIFAMDQDKALEEAMKYHYTNQQYGKVGTQPALKAFCGHGMPQNMIPMAGSVVAFAGIFTQVIQKRNPSCPAAPRIETSHASIIGGFRTKLCA
jgi:hypothetical protein